MTTSKSILRAKKKAEQEQLEPFYRPIDPTSDYDSKALIQHYEDVSDMREYLQTLQKDPENTGAREDAGKLLRTNPLYYFNANRSPRSDLEETLSQEYNNFGEYAIKHSSTLHGKLESEDYADLIQRVPLYEIGNEEHDEFVGVVNENRKLAEASRDPEKMADYIRGKIKNFPKWAQISFMRYGENDLKLIFQSYMNSANAKLKAIMFDEKGKVRSNFLERVFRDSLDEAEEDLKDEDYSEEERNDVWERNVRPYYVALIEKVYEKEKEDEDIPERNEDRNERRAERRAKGMPF